MFWETGIVVGLCLGHSCVELPIAESANGEWAVDMI